jgi:thiol-disulfide isomerase/thioredoxin
MKKRIFSLLLAFVMILSLSACSGEGEETTEKPTESDEAPAHTHGDEEITTDAAPDFTVYNKEGKSVKLSDMKGTPVVLNFWASWCPPCKSEMPDFDAIAKEYEGKVVFMMVNLTDGQSETQESAQAFIDSMGYTFPVYFDKDSDAAYKYGIQSIPTTFFIDANGNLIAYGQGAMDGDTLKRGISMIYAEEK